MDQNTLLLSTKLKIPAPRKNYVVRKTLFDSLSQCADMSIIFVRGGAGTGKTTLLSSYIREKELKNVCWMSLDASNSNIYSFWLYFTAAVSTFWEDGGSLLELMQSNPDAAHMENFLILIINRLSQGEDYYMVLDDIHCLSDPVLIKTFEFFLGGMPSNFHLFLLSREDPPVYLGPLAVSGRLLFIDGKQMQLTFEEGISFLKYTLNLKVSDEELNQLNTYAEGWIGGLQLAAAAEAAGRKSSRFLRAGGGIAMEYLTREVLEALNQKEREFLIRTGFLTYFDADICAEIFDELSPVEFNEMMDDLIYKNLMVICIDEQNGVYRYHNILSEYLTQQFDRLPEAQKKELYKKTAKAFEARKDYEEALREYTAAGEYQEVIRIAHGMEGRIEAWSYLDQIPIELLMKDADLAAQCFMYNLGNLKIERCRILFEEFKEHYGDSDIFSVVRFAEAYLMNHDGIIPQYQALSTEQIDVLPFGSVTKAMLLVENSAALLEQMKYEEAEICINKAFQISAGTNIFVEFYAHNQLAQIYEETGRLKDSLLSYSRSEKLLKSPSMMLGIGTNYYFGLTGVYMRQMEIDKAMETLDKARCLMEDQHIRVAIADATLTYHLAEMKFLSGDNEGGVSYVEGIIAEYPNYSVLTLGRLLQDMDCAGLLPFSFSESFLKEIETVKNYRMNPYMKLLRARFLYKHGHTSEALKETEDLLTFSRLHKNKLRLVEADILKIYLLLQAKDKIEVREINNLLREAVHYAHYDRILMPFYLDRKILLPLLIELSEQSRGKSPMTTSEVAFVLEAIAICSPLIVNAIKKEILSVRELEILKELALGITNREIADKLCISQATVKTHIISVFSKLGVSSRMLAVEQARKDGLIQ